MKNFDLNTSSSSDTILNNINSGGYKFIATYKDGTTQDVTDKCKYSITKTGSYEGNKVIYISVTYTEDGVTVKYEPSEYYAYNVSNVL